MENIKITNLWMGNRIRTHYIVIADSVRFGKNCIMYEGQLYECVFYLLKHGYKSFKASY